MEHVLGGDVLRSLVHATSYLELLDAARHVLRLQHAVLVVDVP
jgi:hypothetical protein